MSRPLGYDRNELHALMWHRSGRRRVFNQSLRDFSVETGISYFHLTRIVQEFVQEGRLKILGRGRSRLQSFSVKDPVYWNVEHGTPEGAATAKNAVERLGGLHA